MNKKRFEEPLSLNDVACFHDTFNLPVIDNPKIPDEDRCRLRINLLEEELMELKAAIEHKDLVEVADAFCDLQYVLSGAILEFGLAAKFKDLFEEVQRSNMSKVCQSMEEAEATVAAYEAKGQAGHIVQKGEIFLVYRNQDGKVLKSVNYNSADLDSLLT
jgi:predicted HAD superfamily Cof-like phosphohydrolase